LTETFYIPEESVSFGNLPRETVFSLFRDGRVASPFLERAVELWYPHLEFVDGKGYDHVDKNTQHKYDLKCFTKGGLKFAPSVMIGAGRKIDEEKLHEHASTISYICCDIVDFPKIRIKFISGKDLIKDYPKGSIRFSHRERFFTCMDFGTTN